MTTAEKFDLSEKIEINHFSQYDEMLQAKDVKEFIRLLRKELREEFWTRKIDDRRSAYWISFIIDKLAGEKLT